MSGNLLAIERVLRERLALQDLQTLVDAGCNRGELLSLLQLARLPSWTDESWKTLVGMELPRLKREIKRIRHCADVINRLNRSRLIYHVSIEIHLPRFVGLRDSPAIADQLHQYADKLDWLRQRFGPKAKMTRSA